VVALAKFGFCVLALPVHVHSVTRPIQPLLFFYANKIWLGYNQYAVQCTHITASGILTSIYPCDHHPQHKTPPASQKWVCGPPINHFHPFLNWFYHTTSHLKTFQMIVVDAASGLNVFNFPRPPLRVPPAESGRPPLAHPDLRTVPHCGSYLPDSTWDFVRSASSLELPFLGHSMSHSSFKAQLKSCFLQEVLSCFFVSSYTVASCGYISAKNVEPGSLSTTVHSCLWFLMNVCILQQSPSKPSCPHYPLLHFGVA
jgi:hypothetical protein